MTKTYKPFHPDHEFLGRTVLNMQSALGPNEVHRIFEKHGFRDVDPDKWYSAKPWFDAITEIGQSTGSMMDFVAIGMKSVENAHLPDAVRAMPLTDFFQGAAQTYSRHNRGTDTGSQACVVVDDHHVKMILRMPHPDDFWFGAFYKLMQRLLPAGTDFRVYYDEEIPRREEGGERTIIHIEWSDPA